MTGGEREPERQLRARRETLRICDGEGRASQRTFPDPRHVAVAGEADLAPLGVAALFGQSSGPVDPLNLGILAQKGSLFVTRPTLNTYAAKHESLIAMAKELFDVVLSGAVKIEVRQTYPLKDAARAHADLAARKTTGSTVFLV